MSNSFIINVADLQKILEQIKIAEAHAAGASLADLIGNPQLPWGLRTVDGSYNNFLPGREQWGAADTVIPRLLDGSFVNAGNEPFMDLNGPEPGTGYTGNYGNPGNIVDSDPRVISNLIVDMSLNNPAAIVAALTYAGSEDVVGDLQRIIAAKVTPAQAAAALAAAQTALDDAEADVAAAVLAYNTTPNAATLDAIQDAAAALGDAEAAFARAQAVNADPAGAQVAMAEELGLTFENGSLVIPNVAPDEGLSAPFNSWMTFFGQFFDHGLDLITKGGNGTIYIPLQADDPLIAGADGQFGTADDLPAQQRFMVLTRATPAVSGPGPDGILLDNPATAVNEAADNVSETRNTTTSWVDQNQTYTSHASHQLFLREYVLVGGKPVATGHLLDGTNPDGSKGGLPTWADIKAQARSMLGIELTDLDVLNIPLLRTDPYGEFIRGTNGLPLLVVGLGPDGVPNTADDIVVEGNLATPVNTFTAANGALVGAIRIGHAFLDDIAHNAVPKGLIDHDRNPATAMIQQTPDDDTVAGNAIVPNAFGINLTYDDELLNEHFITGDGRGNENIGLSAVHHIFHSEHNRLVEQNKLTILQSGDLNFINEWLLVDLPNLAAIPNTAAGIAALGWDGERLFQAARFGTEMQYQHLVFEEFARKVQPQVDLFVFNNSPDINPTIFAEFAHTVYRFGHSMLTETIARTNADGTHNDIGLIEAFLNPLEYFNNGTNAPYTADQAAGAIIRGLTNQRGNSIDEFITGAVRSNLLGLPLDLAAINIARGRDTGVPTLNEARAQLYAASSSTFLTPYSSWADFAANLKNPASLVNFIAAYGQHATVLAATNLADKRAAAMELVFGVDANGLASSILDRLDFLHSTAGSIWNAATSGLNSVDFWIGGLAEKIMPFGGMLGSTFNAVFELQMENLQDGDRLYYLTRTQGMNLLTSLENNSFSKLMMRNTDMAQPGPDGIRGTQDDIIGRHIGVDSFANYDFVLEVNIANQDDENGALPGKDPVGNDAYLEAIGLGKVQRDNPSTPGADANYIKFVGGEHIAIGGTSGNDTIISDYGDDAIWGGDGDDRIESGAGVDLVMGGAGNDIITDSGDSGDFIKGDDGDDVIANSNGLDILMGGDGKDVFLVGVDETEIFAGAGDDFILGGEAADFLMGGEGDDWIEGGPGFDVISGENSELFFNSPIIGHDILIGNGGGDMDYDAESGDDIMVQDETVTRNEGMNGFDWAIHKNDPFGADSDLAIPIFTTVVADILRDRFDAVEGLSGWKHDDVLRGDDRGHSGGSSSPDSVPVELFTDHVLDRAGIERIAGLETLLEGRGATNPLPNVTSFKNGNILLGGDGNDLIQGRGGFDVIDGDAWLNVRIRIVAVGAANTPANQIATIDTLRHVFSTADGVNAAWVGKSMAELLLSGTIKPSQLHAVREILYDNTDVTGPNKNIDTAVFQGGDLEYDIEGTRIVYDAATGEALRRVNIGQGDNSTQALNIRDVNGDGFITVRDLDDGTVAAPGRVGGLTVSRGALTDDTDQLVNIERLQFADRTLNVGVNPTNSQASGVVTIFDPTPFDHDNNPATPGVVSPIVGQVLTAKLTNLVDTDGFGPLDPVTGLPPGGTFEWQTTEAGNDGGWVTITTGLTYTVRTVDPAHVLRAVAVFKDNKQVTERIASMQTDNVTAPFSVNENTASGTVIAPIPFSLDYDPLGFGGTGVTDGDLVQLTHVMSPGNDAGGRFTIVNTGTAANPVYQLAVANGGPQMLNYEAGVHTTANQSHQFVDNQYQIIIDSYTDTIANGGTLMASRQFTIILNDVTGEVVDIAPTLDLNADATVTTSTPFPQAYRDQFDAVANNNSNGTSNWTATWTETGDGSTGVASGDIVIAGGRLQFTQTSDNDDAIARAVNGLPADVTSATLSFTYASVGLDDGTAGGLFGDRERVVVEVRNTATGGWTEIGNLGGNNPNGSFSAPIAAALIGANTQIRFRVETDTLFGGNSTFEAGESFSIENVNIALVRNVVSTVPGSPGNNFTTSYTEGGAAVGIASNAAVGNDHTGIMSATIRLTNAQAQDVLTASGLPAGITASYGPAVAGEITLFLTGFATLAAYQTAIQAVRFSNSGDNPGSVARLLEVSVNDGVQSSPLATATINVTAVNDAPSGGNDAIITNVAIGSPVIIPEWVLLANDTDPDSAVLDITAVSVGAGLTASLGANGITLVDTGAAGGSFTYTVSDGIANDPTPPSVGLTSVASTNSTTYSEGFGAGSNYTDNDGSWADNWTENGDDSSSTSDNGQIRIANTRLEFDNGNTVANSNGAYIERGLGDLAGATSATISYSYGHSGLEAGETLAVEFFNGTSWQTVQTITSATTGTSISNFALTGPFTAASALRFTVSALNDANDLAWIDAISVAFTTPAPVSGTNNGEILVGDINGSSFDAGLGDDFVLAGDGNDTIIWNANANGATDGRDFVDGGSGSDTFDLNTRNGTTESFRVYTVAAALSGPNAIAGLTAAQLRPGTEIIITRTTGSDPVTAASIMAELDNIEEIRIGTQTSDPTNGSAGNGDTVAIFGDFSTTSLALNTITIDGTAGDDTIDISALTSAHRIVFKSNGGHDTIVGTLRPQDVIELPAGVDPTQYTSSTTDGVTTLTDGQHTISYVATGAGPQIGGSDEEDDEDDDDDDHVPGDDDDEDDGDDDGDDGDDDAPAVGGPILGTPQDDVLLGTSGGDLVFGFAGTDYIIANAGVDVIRAGAGDDFVDAGAGRDIIFADDGDDDVFGGDDDDLIYGEGGHDRLFGDNGNDLVDAGEGNDSVFGGAGNDLFMASLNDGNDTYYGGDISGDAGNDTLDMAFLTTDATVDLGTGVGGRGSAVSSQSGTDTLYGVENVTTGSGDDTITMSSAVNVVDGGAGEDIFVFGSAAAAHGDTIKGFEAGDKIDLSGIDANAGLAGNNTFTLETTTTAPGQIVVTHETREDGEYTVVSGNTAGDNAPEFRISIAGNHNLTGSDFSL